MKNRILHTLYQSFLENSHRIALQIGENPYTYQDLLLQCSAIRKQLQSRETLQNIGLYLSNDFEMYAALLAIWFEGKTYVPIHPDFPREKNEKILSQAGCDTLLSSIPVHFENNTTQVIHTQNLPSELPSPPKEVPEESFAYILFTSGSTGEPKGVPLSFSNLFHFSEAYEETFGKLSKEDKVLQMFELTFDMSVVSYLMPWLCGATVVGLHGKEVKFLQILDLLEANEITVAQMVPSIANLMLPYLDPNVKNESLRSVFFAGEALLAKSIAEWRKFVPNAQIYNAYGPTENTIVCTAYLIPEENPKQRNGVLSIGSPMKHNIIRFENNQNTAGELLLGGKLLTQHYWKNPQKDAEVFTEIEGNRLYKSGDWCERDEDGDIFYINRIDFQTKINGYRVELSEIEFFANQICQSGTCVALAVKDNNQNDQIILFSDDHSLTPEHITQHLQQHLPPYMIPSIIKHIPQFPYTLSGKVDRQTLKNQYL